MSIKAFERYEKKYLITKDKFERIIDVILEHMNFDSYCENKKSYSIYNLYLDEEDRSVIRNCALYPNYKEKMRIRCYKPSDMNSCVFLELKRKINSVTTKRRVELTLKEALDFILNNKEINKDSYIDKQIIKEMSYYLKHHNVKPKTYLSYERIALFGKDNKSFRITFDKNLKARRENLDLINNDGDLIIDDNNYIMEIKINGSIPLWLTELLSKEKIYSQGFSKYKTEYIKNIDVDCINNNFSNNKKKVCLNG